MSDKINGHVSESQNNYENPLENLEDNLSTEETIIQADEILQMVTHEKNQGKNRAFYPSSIFPVNRTILILKGYHVESMQRRDFRHTNSGMAPLINGTLIRWY